MILLPNSTYVELYATMAEAIMVEHQGDLIELYEPPEEEGDVCFTEEAQDLFDEYCSLVEGVLADVGIGQDYDLAATENMAVVAI